LREVDRGCPTNMRVFETDKRRRRKEEASDVRKKFNGRKNMLLNTSIDFIFTTINQIHNPTTQHILFPQEFKSNSKPPQN
jgi:hypothetical protein